MKRFFKMLIMGVITFVVTLTASMASNSHGVEAANVAGKLNVSFTVVDYDKYVTYLTLKQNLFAIDEDGFGPLTDYFTDGYTNTNYLFPGEKRARKIKMEDLWNYPELMNDSTYFNKSSAESTWTDYYAADWSSYGATGYDVITNVINMKTAAEQNVFVPSTASKTEYFGVVYSVQSDTKLVNLAIGIQYSKISSSITGSGPLSTAETKNALSKVDITVPSGTALPSHSAVDGTNIVTYGNYASSSTAGYSVQTQTDLCVVRIPISTTANGDYTLTLAQTTDVLGRFVGGAEFKGDSSNFNVAQTATVTIQGASAETATTFTSGTSVSNVTTAHTSKDDSTTPKTVKMAEVAASYTDVYLKGTVAAGGKVSVVKYASSASLASTGTVVSEQGGAYKIPMTCDTNASMYAYVKVTASDNVATDEYIVEIPRGKYDIAELTGLSLDIGGNAVSLYASSTATTATTFSSTTKTYYIRLKNSEESINIKPKWNTDYNETCKVITSTSSAGVVHTTSDSSVAYTHSGTGDITIRMIDEANSKNVDYIIHVYRLSDDATMSYFKYGTTSSNISSTPTGSGTNLSGTAVKGTTAIWFKFKPTNAKATLQYAFEDDSEHPGTFTNYTSDTGVQCTFTSGTGAATMYIHVKVTSESGESEEEYVLTIVRDAGSKETGIDGIKVSYNGSTTYDTAVKQSDNITYIVTNKYTFTGLTTDKFRFQIAQKSGQVGKQTITYYKDGDSATVYSYSGTNSGDIFFSTAAEETIKIVIKVQAEDPAEPAVIYNLEVTRAKASDNVQLASVAVISGGVTYNYTLATDGETYEYTAGLIPYTAYSGQQFNLKFTQKEAGQTFTYTSDDKNSNSGVATSGSNTTFTYADSYTTQTVIIDLTVQALDGNTTKTYHIKVVRDGASKETGINALVVKYNGTTQTPIIDGKTYTVNNMEFKDKTNDYLSFAITGKDSAQTITYVSDDVAYPGSPVSVTSGAEYKIKFSSYLEETITVDIKVLAPDHNASATYTVIVTRKAASTKNELDTDSFKVYKVDDTVTKTQLAGAFDSSNNYVLTNPTLEYAEYPAGTKVINAGIGFDVKIPEYSKLTITSDRAHSDTFDNSTSATASAVTYRGAFAFANKNEITVNYTLTVTAQDSSTSEYHVTVTRKAANDDISGITVSAHSSDPLNPYNYVIRKTGTTGLNYRLLYQEGTLELPYAVKNLYILIESSVGTTKAYYSGTDVTGVDDLYQIPDNLVKTSKIENRTFEFKVMTEADDNLTVARTLKITYTRVAANTKNDIVLDNIVLKDDLGKEYSLSSATKSGKTYTFSWDSRKGMTEYYVTGVELAENSKLATIYVKDGDVTGYHDDLYKYDPDTVHTIGTGNTTYIIVESEAGGTNQYTLNIGFQEILDDNAKMASIAVAELQTKDYEWTTAYAEATFNVEKEIPVEIPYSIKGLTITPTLESNKASFEKDERVAATTIPVGTTRYKFQARAQDGTLGAIYVFVVTRLDGNSENLLNKLTIGSSTIINGDALEYTPQSNAIHHLVAQTTTNARLTYEVSTNAKVDIRLLGDATGSDSTTSFNTNLVSGAKNEIVMRITSEKDFYDGKTSSYNEYHIYIYPASDTLEVDEIVAYVDNSLAELLIDSDGNQIRYDFDKPIADTQEFHVPYTSKQAYIDVSLPINLVGVVDVQKTSKGTLSQVGITYTITVKSQYAALAPDGVSNNKKVYKMKLIQDAASLENRLEELHVNALIGGVVTDLITSFDKDNNNYVCESVDASVTSVSVAYKLLSPNHSKIAAASDVGNVAIDLANNSKTLRVTVLNELEQENTYTIVLTSGKIDWETNPNISDIKALVDSKNIIQPFDSTQIQYSATVRAATTEVVFHVATVAPTATVTITTADGTQNMTSSASNTLNTYTASIVAGQKNVFKFKCTAQDGTHQSAEYTVEITSVAADTVNTLKIFNVNGVDVKDGDVLKVKEEVESVPVLVQADSAYATISPYNNPTDLVYGENIISVTVTAENESHKTYTCKVIRDYPVDLEDIVIYKKTDTTKTELINVEKDNVLSSYEIPKFPYEYGDLVLVVEATAKSGENVTITGNGDWTIDETGKKFKREITVTASSGVSKTYEIYAERAEGNAENKILHYRENSSVTSDVDGFSSNKNTITYWVERTVEYFEPVIEVSETALVNDVTGRKYSVFDSKGKEIISDNPRLEPGKNVFTIKVYSETHEENAYTVTVYKAENVKGFDDIKVLTSANADATAVVNTKTGNPYSFSNFVLDNTKYVNSISVSNKQSQIYLEFAVQGDYTKVYVNGVEFTKEVEGGQTVYQGFVKLNKVGAGNANVITMYTLSELGSYTSEFTGVKSDEYVLSVEREEVNGDAKLKTLEVLVDGVNQIVSFDPDEPEYLINNIGSVNQITINATPNATSSTVSGTGVRQLSDASVNFYSFTVTCTAENGDTGDYIVKISRTKMTEDEANSDNTLSFVVIDNNNNVVMTPQFEAATTTYNVTIPYTAQSYIVKLSTKVGSKAKTYVDGVIVDGMKQFTAGDRTDTTHTIYAKSALNKDGTKYTVNVIFEQPSNDASLKSLKVVVSSTIANRSSKTFNIQLEPEKNNYKLDKQPYEYDLATITAVATDAKAVVTGNGLSYDLVEGDDTQLTITVRAEGGETVTYTVTIPRAAEAPYLTDLRVVGNVLKDPTTSSETDFDPYTLNYLVDVENGDKDSTTIPATIKVQVDNRAYTVSSDNAVRSVSGYVTTFQVNLVVGTNTFNITVQSPEDPENNTVYVLKVNRKAPQSADANISMLKIVRTDGTATETLRANSIYSESDELVFEAPNSMTELVVTPTLSSTTSTYEVINNKLNVGENTVLILVTAEDGTKNYTTIKVTRDDFEFDIKVNEIADFRQDYANGSYKNKPYNVKSNVTGLTFEVNHSERKNSLPIEYVVVNGGQLAVGENKVSLQITCDGETYPVEFTVVREAMDFEVLQNNGVDTNYTCAPKANANDVYVIDLGKDGKASDITDYTKYIKAAANSDLVVEKLTDTSRDDCNEVYLKVSTADGTESKIVKLELTSEKSPATSFDLYVWIVLGLAIILLIIILICVNRDKYGSVSRKRKNI